MVTTIVWITTLWPATGRADQGEIVTSDEGSTGTGDS